MFPTGWTNVASTASCKLSVASRLNRTGISIELSGKEYQRKERLRLVREKTSGEAAFRKNPFGDV
jgi:hypothetical protein